MSTTDGSPHVLAGAGDFARHAVTNIFFGDSTDDCIIIVMCRGKRFHITISPENLQDHKHEYTRLINGLTEARDDADFDLDSTDPQDELEDWVLRPFIPVFPKLAPKQSLNPQRATVTECFNPPTFFFALKSIRGNLSAIRTTDNSKAAEFWIPRVEIAPALIRPGLRIVRPHDLEVVWDPQLEDGPHAAQVALGTTEHYFLKYTTHGDEQRVTRDVESLLRLQDLGVTEKIRLPKLHGYVQYEGEDRISGLLLTCIDARGTLATIVSFEDPSEKLKRKWINQIEVMLKAIHQAGVVWGDVKADNVLIDKQNNAWIIDFGGSYTPGWVDKDKMETVEGDLQGLWTIKHFLGFA